MVAVRGREREREKDRGRAGSRGCPGRPHPYPLAPRRGGDSRAEAPCAMQYSRHRREEDDDDDMWVLLVSRRERGKEEERRRAWLGPGCGDGPAQHGEREGGCCSHGPKGDEGRLSPLSFSYFLSSFLVSRIPILRFLNASEIKFEFKN